MAPEIIDTKETEAILNFLNAMGKLGWEVSDIKVRRRRYEPEVDKIKFAGPTGYVNYERTR